MISHGVTDNTRHVALFVRKVRMLLSICFCNAPMHVKCGYMSSLGFVSTRPEPLPHCCLYHAGVVVETALVHTIQDEEGLEFGSSLRLVTVGIT